MTRWLTLVGLLVAPAALACMNSYKENEYGQLESKMMSDADKALNKATHELAHGMNRKALENAEAALADAPLDWGNDAPQVEQAHLIAGEAALKLEKYEKALKHLSSYASLPSARPHLRARLAEAQVGSGELVEGAAVLEALAQDDLLPDAQAWVALMRAREAKGDHPGAVVAANTALERDPRNLAAKYFLHPEQAPSSRAPVAGALGLCFLGLSLVLARRRGWLLATVVSR